MIGSPLFNEAWKLHREVCKQKNETVELIEEVFNIKEEKVNE